MTPPKSKYKFRKLLYSPWTMVWRCWACWAFWKWRPNSMCAVRSSSKHQTKRTLQDSGWQSFYAWEVAPGPYSPVYALETRGRALRLADGLSFSSDLLFGIFFFLGQIYWDFFFKKKRCSPVTHLFAINIEVRSSATLFSPHVPIRSLLYRVYRSVPVHTIWPRIPQCICTLYLTACDNSVYCALALSQTVWTFQKNSLTPSFVTGPGFLLLKKKNNKLGRR